MPCARLRSILALVALLALVTVPAFPVSAGTTVTDPGNRFSFQLPDSWQTLPGGATADSTVLGCRTTNPDGTFAVVTAPVLSAMASLLSPDTIASVAYGVNPAIHVENTAQVTVAGEVGAEVDLIQTDDAGTVTAQQQLFVPHKGTVYQLVFVAKPDDIDAVRTAGASLLTSWQWLG